MRIERTEIINYHLSNLTWGEMQLIAECLRLSPKLTAASLANAIQSSIYDR